MTMQNLKFDNFKEKFKQRLYNFTFKLNETSNIFVSSILTLKRKNNFEF